MVRDFDTFDDETIVGFGYLATNETVEAVVKGLAVNSDDQVLAICGSGDIPFGLLEKARTVVAIDRNFEQVQYAEWRLKKLTEKNIESFLRFIDNGRGEKNVVNRTYFFVGDRLSNITSCADKIEFRISNIFKMIENNNRFTKIYLSNVLGFGVNNSSDLASISSYLVPNGLLYVTQDRFYGKERFFELPKEIVEDEEHTMIARYYEQFWVNPGPVVFRKIKN